MGVVFGKINEETPDHTVISKSDGYEVWRYTPSVAAAVYASDLATDEQGAAPTGREFQGTAFKLLAKYIGVFTTPENAGTAPDSTSASSEAGADPTPVAMTAPVVVTPPPQKIGMTAPVVMGSAESATGESMKFLLPQKYQKVEDAPKPKDDRVKLEFVPGDRVEAVLPFSWGIDMDRSKEKADELKKMLDRDGVKVTGEWNVQGYNPPFTLPWCKRNEIHMPVDPNSVKTTSDAAEASEASEQTSTTTTA